MPKIQKIKRKNGTEIFNVNIPTRFAEEMEIEKGEEVEFDRDEANLIIKFDREEKDGQN